MRSRAALGLVVGAACSVQASVPTAAAEQPSDAAAGDWSLLDVEETAGVAQPVEPQVGQAAGPPAGEPAPEAATNVRLAYGELRSIPVEGLLRVAVGSPQVADVTIVSDSELLLHAKQIGSTSLIIWDRQGRREIAVTVIDVLAEEAASQLERLLRQFKFDDVRLKREGLKLFVVGTVATAPELERLQGLISSFPGAINLVSVTPPDARPDTPPPGLVRLSVQILELDRSFSEKLGVKWNETFGVTETPPSASRRIGDMFKIGQLSRTGFAQTVNFLVQKGKGRVLAEPVLVTASGKQASSFMGQQIPIIASTTSGITTGGVSSNVEFRSVGVKLVMTPTVLAAHDKISTVLQAEVSSVDDTNSIQIGSGSTTTKVPGFKTRQAQTEVITGSGETIVIAGLLQLTESENVSQLPAVGGIPVVGRLFRSPSIEDKKTELVIAVTPELLAGGEETLERTISIDRALASAESVGMAEDPRMRYALRLQDRIARALRYPDRERERGVEGRVKLRLHVFADGTLDRALVAESSGVEALDSEALKAAQTQSPYPQFPSPLAQRDLWVEVPVVFRL